MKTITEQAVEYYQGNTKERSRDAFLRFHQQVARCVEHDVDTFIKKNGREPSREEFEDICNEVIYWFNEDWIMSDRHHKLSTYVRTSLLLHSTEMGKTTYEYVADYQKLCYVGPVYRANYTQLVKFMAWLIDINN